MDPILPASSDDDLDDLLRPPRRPIQQILLDRIRVVDRRLLVVSAVAAAAVLGVLAFVGWRSRPVPVVLPMAQPEPTATARAAGAPAAAGPTTTSPAGPLVVHVAGAVVRPGLVSLPAGSRTADAIEQAGGAAAGADLERVNLAAPVADGMRVYVPSIGQVDVPSAVGATPAGPSAGAEGPAGGDLGPVDLNTATGDQLETLPGVGPATAAAILAHRDSHGPFTSVDGLDEVRGIGPAKLEQLRDLVVAG